MKFENRIKRGGSGFWSPSTMVAPRGFEPRSRDPESRMLGRYTTGLCPLVNPGDGFIKFTPKRKGYLFKWACSWNSGRAGGLAWIERRPPEPKVAGSNPARPAISPCLRKRWRNVVCLFLRCPFESWFLFYMCSWGKSFSLRRRPKGADRKLKLFNRLYLESKPRLKLLLSS